MRAQRTHLCCCVMGSSSSDGVARAECLYARLSKAIAINQHSRHVPKLAVRKLRACVRGSDVLCLCVCVCELVRVRMCACAPLPWRRKRHG